MPRFSRVKESAKMLHYNPAFYKFSIGDEVSFRSVVSGVALTDMHLSPELRRHLTHTGKVIRIEEGAVRVMYQDGCAHSIGHWFLTSKQEQERELRLFKEAKAAREERRMALVKSRWPKKEVQA